MAAILRLFAGQQQSWRLIDIAAAASLSKATAHRVLKALCREEILQRSTEDGAYLLGPLASSLGVRAFGPDAIRLRARSILQGLAAMTGETALMFQLSPAGDAAVCIEQIESIHGLRLVTDIGTRFPLTVGGSSRAILAYLPEKQAAAALAALPEDAARRLREKIDRTRKQGYTLSIQETNEGVGGVAAPLFDPLDRVVGSISLVGPLTRMSEDRLTALAPDLVAAAAAIDATADHHSPNDRPARVAAAPDGAGTDPLSGREV